MTDAARAAGPAPAVLAAIETLHATLLMARALRDGGRRIDLGGLDAQAAALCTAVVLLPHEAGRALRPALEAVAREVDVLAAALAVTG